MYVVRDPSELGSICVQNRPGESPSLGHTRDPPLLSVPTAAGPSEPDRPSSWRRRAAGDVVRSATGDGVVTSSGDGDGDVAVSATGYVPYAEGHFGAPEIAMISIGCEE
eukprot:1158048_1